MSQQTDAWSRKGRRFFPQVIETCSRRVEGTRARLGTANTGILKEKAFPHSDAENKSSTHFNPVSENSSEVDGPSSRRPKEIGGQEPISKRQHGRPLPELGEPVVFKKQRLESEPMEFRQQRVPLLSDKPPHSRPRRFEPEVIETVKRSFRRGGTEQASDSGNPLEYQPTYLNKIAGNGIQPTLNAGAGSVPESRFSYSNLLRRQQERRHSFRVPDLPPIPSNANEGSDGEYSSVLTLPPQSAAEPVIPKASSHHRESCDESHASYILSLASRTAETQLKEQALAAFPNEQVYQPVDHFAIDRESDESLGHGEFIISSENIENTKYRRASSADLSWALEHMRLHKEEAETRGHAMLGANRLQVSSTVPISHREFHQDEHAGVPGERKGTASPPMLGDDLIFPQSLSPQGTLCADYHTSSHQDSQDGPCGDCGGLWRVDSRTDKKSGKGGGLWMGTCQNLHKTAPKSQQGLLPGVPITTIVPGSAPTYQNRVATDVNLISGSRTSARGDSDRKSSGQDENTTEFDDTFVTQIYNYLSLGYSCIARFYDYELSEVSGIPVQELRQDDRHTDAKGYIGVIQDHPSGGDSGRKCKRWLALRLYINEFASHQSRMVENVPTVQTWGVLERKGSWAF